MEFLEQPPILRCLPNRVLRRGLATDGPRRRDGDDRTLRRRNLLQGGKRAATGRVQQARARPKREPKLERRRGPNTVPGESKHRKLRRADASHSGANRGISRVLRRFDQERDVVHTPRQRRRTVLATQRSAASGGKFENAGRAIVIFRGNSL